MAHNIRTIETETPRLQRHFVYYKTKSRCFDPFRYQKEEDDCSIHKDAPPMPLTRRLSLRQQYIDSVLSGSGVRSLPSPSLQKEIIPLSNLTALVSAGASKLGTVLGLHDKRKQCDGSSDDPSLNLSVESESRFDKSESKLKRHSFTPSIISEEPSLKKHLSNEEHHDGSRKRSSVWSENVPEHINVPEREGVEYVKRESDVLSCENAIDVISNETSICQFLKSRLLKNRSEVAIHSTKYAPTFTGRSLSTLSNEALSTRSLLRTISFSEAALHKHHDMHRNSTRRRPSLKRLRFLAAKKTQIYRNNRSSPPEEIKTPGLGTSALLLIGLESQIAKAAEIYRTQIPSSLDIFQGVTGGVIFAHFIRVLPLLTSFGLMVIVIFSVIIHWSATARHLCVILFHGGSILEDILLKPIGEQIDQSFKVTGSDVFQSPVNKGPARRRRASAICINPLKFDDEEVEMGSATKFETLLLEQSNIAAVDGPYSNREKLNDTSNAQVVQSSGYDAALKSWPMVLPLPNVKPCNSRLTKNNSIREGLGWTGLSIVQSSDGTDQSNVQSRNTSKNETKLTENSQLQSLKDRPVCGRLRRGSCVTFASDREEPSRALNLNQESSSSILNGKSKDAPLSRVFGRNSIRRLTNRSQNKIVAEMIENLLISQLIRFLKTKSHQLLIGLLEVIKRRTLRFWVGTLFGFCIVRVLTQQFLNGPYRQIPLAYF